MINLENITVKYGSKLALIDFTHKFQTGKITGVIGLNGSGKTTLINAIMNTHSKQLGKLTFNGIAVDKNNYHRKEIGYIPEHIELYEDLSGVEYIKLIAGFRGVEKIDQKVEKLAQIFEIEEFIKKPIEAFSKGNKKKLVIIASIIHNPKLLILDEAFDGLDQETNKFFEQFIIDYRNRGNTIILVSHNLKMITEICDDILYIKDGKKVTKNDIILDHLSINNDQYQAQIKSRDLLNAIEN